MWQKIKCPTDSEMSNKQANKKHLPVKETLGNVSQHCKHKA